MNSNLWTHAEDGIDLLVFGPDPGHERKRRQTCAQVVGEPEPDKGQNASDTCIFWSAFLRHEREVRAY